MKLLKRAAKLRRTWREKGWAGVKQSLRRFVRRHNENKRYQRWIKLHRLTEDDRLNIRRQIEAFQIKPKISIVVPVYNVEERWLRLCVESVLKQLYENWELCIADDFSPAPHVRRVLEEYAAQDARFKLVFREENGHISAASNSALALATSEFVALLDHDDELSEDALFYVIKEINRFPETAMIYSDEDLIDESGRRYAPKFKPDWSRDLFYSLNLITHLSAYRADILKKIGGFRLGLEGSQDYDLALRVVENIDESQIRHIPHILYHWRAIRGSVALSGDEKPYAHERARIALRSHFERTGRRAVVKSNEFNLHRVRYELPENTPKLSLIILLDDINEAGEAVKVFGENTNYKNYEIVLVVKSETELPKDSVPPVKIIFCESAGEAERYNAAVSNTDGDILCLVDANLKPLAKDWLTELAGFASQTEIGAVGAKLLYADESVLHGGLIIGTDDLIGIAHQHFWHTDGGNFVRARVTGNFSAVSGSCLAVRREAFESVNGFDAEHFPNKLYDVDFCLKLSEKNKRIVFTPYAELIKISIKKRLNLEKDSTAEEIDYFKKKWREKIERDAFYNPNLSKKDANFSIKI